MEKYTKFLEYIEVDGFKINCIKNDITITNYLKNNGKLWEDWLEKYIKEAYIENTNMIDIGANIGTFSLMMSKYISENSKIYAFEPVYYEILTTNVVQNNLNEQIIVHPIGLSNKKEKLQGFLIDFSIEANYGFTQLDDLEKADDTSKYIINLITLDSLNIENVSFIKIDVEGSERKVLDGAINTIIKNLPTILIEIWSTSKNSIERYNDAKYLPEIKKQFSIFEFLFNLGYICIPVSPLSDDFLFIHYTKKELLNNIINIINIL
jgi:FkbM family methyltransferase